MLHTEEMSLKLPQGFSFFGSNGWFDKKRSNFSEKSEIVYPSFKLQTDKEVYRPGDFVIATMEISNPGISKLGNEAELSTSEVCSLLVDNLSIEIKGIEKLDSQWFSIQKPLPGSKQKKGETIFLDCSAPSTVSKVIVACGRTKAYLAQIQLPKILPPSYRGASIRYFYYIRSTVSGRRLGLENGRQEKWSGNDQMKMEARTSLQVWATQNSNYFLNDEGTLFSKAVQMGIYWKEKDADSDWVQANDFSDGFDEGYDSPRDEVSSVSSYTPVRGNTDLVIKKSSSSQSVVGRLSSAELFTLGERSGHLSYTPFSKLTIAEVIENANEGINLHQNERDQSSSLHFPHRNLSTSFDSLENVYHNHSAEPLLSESFIRGRSYNIRIDDQILLRFSPKNSDSTYYFGDMIGGTLTFFPGEGPRRCLEVSITLEISEVINQQYVHPSRKNAPTITKVQNDHHEVVADLLQTSFIFSIPRDGPISFSTPYISVQWSLRFEFFTTPVHVDLSRYEHPLLVEQREKGEWVLPITVCIPPLRPEAPHTRNEKTYSVESLFPS